MPVFISHRTADDSKAQLIAIRLKEKGIVCYLDHFDPTLKPARQITALLVDRIKACTHLMALVTDNTRDSWWVPFEIGVAREAPRRITSYDSSTKTLPEYLTEWPVMTTSSDLDKFAEAYHRDRVTSKGKLATAYRAIATPEEFHSELKSALGQR